MSIPNKMAYVLNAGFRELFLRISNYRLRPLQVDLIISNK